MIGDVDADVMDETRETEVGKRVVCDGEPRAKIKLYQPFYLLEAARQRRERRRCGMWLQRNSKDLHSRKGKFR